MTRANERRVREIAELRLPRFVQPVDSSGPFCVLPDLAPDIARGNYVRASNRHNLRRPTSRGGPHGGAGASSFLLSVRSGGGGSKPRRGLPHPHSENPRLAVATATAAAFPFSPPAPGSKGGMGSRRRPGGAATENSGPAIPALAVRSSPRLRGGGPGEPGPGLGPRRSARNAPAPTQTQETGSPGSDRQHSGEAARRRRLGASSNVSASNSSSRDSDSSTKKRKRNNPSKSCYLQRFKMAQDVAVASPDIAGKENTSSVHAADSNISKLCQGSSLIAKNKRHSSDAVCEVSKHIALGLHETSETVAEQCSTPFSERVCYTGKVRHLSEILGTSHLAGPGNAPAPTQTQETGSSGPGNATTPCSDRQHNGVGASDASASNSLSTDSDTNGNASSSTKKRKRNNPSRSCYLQRFKMAADVAVASPDIAGKENTSSGHVADSNISKLCQFVHETSEAVAKQCSTPFSEDLSHDLSNLILLSSHVPLNLHQAGPMCSIACTTLSPPLQQLNDTQQIEGVKKLMNTPENLHVQLKQELSKLIEVLQLPDNVRFVADQLFEYVLNNHQVVTEPVGILHAFNIALCWRAASLLNCKVDRKESLALAEKSLNCECNEDLVALMYRKLRTLKEKIKGQPVSVEVIRLPWKETSTNSENDHMVQNKEMDLHDKFTNGASQEISTVAEQMISERQEPVQETRRECHKQNDELPSMIVEKCIDLVGNVFSLREKNILCKQQLEISGLVTHRQNNVIRLKEVCSLVLEHIRRSHIDEMTRREKIKLTAQWFTMLMYAFLEHMKFQHEKLEGLQSDTWSSERQLKENLHQVAKSGRLDQDFDQRIALPDSNFVMEEFVHFKEQNDEYRIVESSLSHCQQSSNAVLLMEITSVRNEVLSEPVSIQAMENEAVETSVGSRGGLASEAVDFLENNISCSSDGIGIHSAGCSSSTVPSNDDSIGQEASTSECRNTEHIKIDSIAKPSMLLGGATSLFRGVNSNNDDIIDTYGNHLESPILASSQSFISLVGAQSVLPCMSPHQSTYLSAQQNVAPSRCPPVEAVHTGLLDLGTQAVQDLQPEMQPSILFLDAPLQKMPDDRRTGVQPDRATGLPQGAAETSLHLGDARMQGQGKSDGNVAVDPVLSESPTYPADSPVTLQVSTEVETQTCESSMPATQSTSPPAQQSILGTEAASDLQPEVQPSTSMQDEPEEAEDEPEAVDEPDAVDEPAKAERAAALGALAAPTLHPEMQSSTSTQDVPFERSYLSGMPVLHSPTIHQSLEPSLDPHAGAEPVGMVVDHDLQSEILPSAPVPAIQNTSLLAQQSLATSQHSPAEAELADILGTEPACVLQPLLGEVHDQPNMVPSLEQPTQRPPPILSDDRLKNELHTLMQCKSLLSKDHEHKKALLLMECNQEIEKIKKKYASLLEKEDSTYLETQRYLDDIYSKVALHESLAENFRVEMTPSAAARGRSTRPVMEQPSESSSAAVTAASPATSSSAVRPPVRNSLGSYVRPSIVAQLSSTRKARPQPILPGNLCGTTSSPLVPAPAGTGASTQVVCLSDDES